MLKDSKYKNYHIKVQKVRNLQIKIILGIKPNMGKGLTRAWAFQKMLTESTKKANWKYQKGWLKGPKRLTESTKKATRKDQKG